MFVCAHVCGLYSNDRKGRNIVFCLVVIGSKTQSARSPSTRQAATKTGATVQLSLSMCRWGRWWPGQGGVLGCKTNILY